MNIDHTEYNIVVDGLRQQLILLRRFIDQQDARIKTQEELLNELRHSVVEKEVLVSKFVVTCGKCGTCVRRKDGKWVHVDSNGDYKFLPHTVTIM